MHQTLFRWTFCTLVVFLGSLSSALAQSIDDSRGGAVEIQDSSEYPAKGNRQSSGQSASQTTNQPRVGRKAAQKYMGQHGTASANAESSGASAPSAIGSQAYVPGDHYLAIHVGGFISDNAYKWGGADGQGNVGSWNFGVTYRVGEWVNSMDLGIRLDVASYSLQDGRANKISFLPVVTFPDAGSRFPLYFGAGAGLGVFLNQVPNESSLSLDYQLFGGVRFFEVFKNTGFFVEAGLKNHFLLLSDGQFNGTFAALGSVFTF